MQWTQTEPAGLPITWLQLRNHLRLDDDTQRDYVMELAEAAVAYAEDMMGRSLMVRTVTAVHYLHHGHGGFPFERIGHHHHGRRLPLPRGPIISVTSVQNSDGTDLDYTLEYVGNSAQMVFFGVLLGSSPTITAIYQAGYATARAIPAHLRHGIRMHVSHLYNNSSGFIDRQQLPVPAGLEAFYQLNSWQTGVG